MGLAHFKFLAAAAQLAPRKRMKAAADRPAAGAALPEVRRKVARKAAKRAVSPR